MARKAILILELSQNPIIIGGCGRLGTTLLLSILSCHPRILAIDRDTHALCLDGYTLNGYNKTPRINVPFRLWSIYRNLIKQRISDQFSRWCEKTPRNVIYFERILERFGERVRILNIVRDGRDVITSRHPYDPLRFWITLHRWVQDWETTIRHICEYIEEEFVSNFFSYPHSATKKQNIAWVNPARELNSSSIGRWEDTRYARRIDTLLSDPLAIRLLQHYGYERI